MLKLVIFYLVLAALIGWWPFNDSVIKTMSGQCNYDAGYRDGWDGALYACESDDYMAGYDDGNFESDCHWAKCIKRSRVI
ncbi:MAG: hypothetical protein U5P41_12790 [Gammaproteobacteria bacterium]|nr:hypothetical protein [Gammaproteobacteria bacterium]